MSKKIFASSVISVLIIVLIAGSLLFPALAASRQYTLTLRYYDSIQITYTINYPGSSVWTGAADIPIGGTEISGQVYCADPYTPFHSRVTGLGGYSYWDRSNMASVDELSGYVDGAPWVYSGALNREIESVRWIITNGYRGDFLADDQESQDSVLRLKRMYPNIAEYIDKTVAVMATKVAIWRVVTGDSVQIMETSLDGTERRDGFDILVQSLFNEATSGSGRQESPVTTFNISVEKSQDYKLAYNAGGFDYYGPLTVNTELFNGNASGIKVFLTAGGTDSANVTFADDSFSPLAEDTIYGSDTTAPYITVGGSSADFYIAVPENRNPRDGDQLTIKAMAGAENVAVEEGTPVAYIFGADGIQNWDTIQAFIGAARTGSSVNIYAEASLSTGDTAHSQIYVSKVVENATPLDSDTVFTFRVLHSNDPGIQGAPVSLTDYPVHGAFSTNYSNNTFTLKNGGQAYIDGLPARANDYYQVEEISIPQAFDAAKYSIDIAGFTGKSSGSRTGAFQPGNARPCTVTFYNSRRTISEEAGAAHLWVGKAALDSLIYGHHIENLSFELKLEYSPDNINWRPVLLDGTVIDDTGKIANAPEGIFRLKTTEAAYFELNPAYTYRVTETDPGSGFSYITYSIRCYDLMGKTMISEDYQSLKWNQFGESTYTVKNININSEHLYRLAFGNYSLGSLDLTISKAVEGSVPDGEMFKFQFLYVGEDNSGNPVPLMAVPLSTEPLPFRWVVTGNGITADRISGDGSDVLSLKAGETFTVTDLMEGTYVIRELSSGYEATYSVNGGVKKAAANGATALIALDSDARVDFTNTVTDGNITTAQPATPASPANQDTTIDNQDTPSGGRSPQTGDPGNPTPAIIMILLGIGCIAAAEIYRRRVKS